MKPLKAKDIEKIVKEYLARHQTELGDVEPLVLQGTTHHETYWSVPVGTSHEPPRKFHFYDVLSAVEDEVKRDKKIEILIVPSGTVDPN